MEEAKRRNLPYSILHATDIPCRCTKIGMAPDIRDVDDTFRLTSVRLVGLRDASPGVSLCHLATRYAAARTLAAIGTKRTLHQSHDAPQLRCNFHRTELCLQTNASEHRGAYGRQSLSQIIGGRTWSTATARGRRRRARPGAGRLASAPPPLTCRPPTRPSPDVRCSC